MKFGRAAAEFGWTLQNVNPEWEINRPCIDSRNCQAGEVFWGIKGERDGSQFAANALAKGAQAVVITSEWIDSVSSGSPIVMVDDSLGALTELGALMRREFSGRVLALTGSCGKTTAKELLAFVLSTKYKVLKNPGSYNNHIGVPFTLAQLDSGGYDIAVIEIGANHRGEIAELCQIVQPTAGLITMVGRAHLEGLGNIKGIAEAKGELFRALSAGKTAFVNFDDGYVVGQSQAVSNRVGYGFGYPPAGQAFARIYQGISNDGGFSVLNENYKFPFPDFMKIHALCAVAVAHTWGVETFNIAKALESFKGVEGRMQRKDAGGVIIYDDVYNCNPSSLKAALEFISHITQGRKIAVLGDMLELGEFSEEEHLRAIQLCGELNFDKWFTYGERYAEVEGANNFDSRELLIDALTDYVLQGDVVLFKGSRSMRMEEAMERFINRISRG